MKHFHTLDDRAAEVGGEVARSDWVAVTKSQIQLVAAATGDHQWIHIDEARARSSPFGSTIAHGFLTLSLVPRFFDTTMVVEDLRMGVNYGLNKVRFTAPVPAGSRVRGRLALKAVEPIAGNGLQATWDVTVEREDGGKPACVAEMLVRYYR